jgi:hypothetical protein
MPFSGKRDNISLHRRPFRCKFEANTAVIRGLWTRDYGLEQLETLPEQCQAFP